jgi:PD-(D/E)XK nuclease superfamily
MTLAISNSEIQTFDRCKRKWYATYYLGVVPASEPAASSKNLGTRVHVAMEAQYGYGIDAMAVLRILYQIEIENHPEEAMPLKAEQELAEIMVSGYLEWSASTGDEADWNVVATETDLRVPLPSVPGVELRVRMDQLARRESDGRLAFRDWKTAGNFDKHDMIAMDPQMKFYCMVQQMAATAGGNQNPPLVSGGRITTMRRVKRTDRSKPPYYMTDDFWFNPDQIESAYRRTTKICSQIQDTRGMLDLHRQRYGDDLAMLNPLQRTELAPTPILGNCDWSCPFSTGLCTAMDDGSDWPGIIDSSGRYVRDDPYAYYERNPLATIRAMVTDE